VADPARLEAQISTIIHDAVRHPFGFVENLAALLLLAALACSRSDPVSPTPTPSPIPPSTTPPLQTAVLVGAGDIADCNNDGGRHAQETGRLLDRIDGTVFVAGDAAYPHGSAADFANCFEPAWGRHKTRIRPSPGNHEYESAGAFPYFQYFGGRAGDFGVGFYSYNAGAWHVISLNSSAPLSSGSEQYQWLQDDVMINRSTRCTLAYFHYPRFTSGPSREGLVLGDLWRLLYSTGADVIINGHDHGYERFEPQDPDGIPNPAGGIRQFVVGSGGAPLYPFPSIAPNSAQRISTYGVLKLTLRNTDYDWEFIQAGTEATLDRGMGVCH
jgi:calcineurin-like phosphoesterase family protein